MRNKINLLLKNCFGVFIENRTNYNNFTGMLRNKIKRTCSVLFWGSLKRKYYWSVLFRVLQKISILEWSIFTWSVPSEK
jgi:hypothetical protein